MSKVSEPHRPETISAPSPKLGYYTLYINVQCSAVLNTPNPVQKNILHVKP